MNANTATAVQIGTEIVRIGDTVAENTSAWIKAEVVQIETGVSEYTGKAVTTVTVVWLKDERHGNTIARKGRTRQYSVNSYGVSDIRKVR